MEKASRFIFSQNLGNHLRGSKILGFDTHAKIIYHGNANVCLHLQHDTAALTKNIYLAYFVLSNNTTLVFSTLDKHKLTENFA